MQKFSVLMSVYYKENDQNLDDALKSILINQSILPNEIVMVKDGVLTNELEQVLKKYVAKFPGIFNFIVLKTNVGLGKALEIGVKKCKHNIIMRMDTDDIAVYDRFEQQLNYMKEHKNVSVVGGYIEEFENDVNETFRLKKMPCSYEGILKYAKFRNPINHMTACFRKKDILEVGNYQPLFYLEDHYLWIRVLAAGKKIENISKVLVHARVGSGFSARRGNKKYITGWKKLQKYMHENEMINRTEKYRNMLGMYAFIYIPAEGREYLYNNFLRKRKPKQSVKN